MPPKKKKKTLIFGLEPKKHVKSQVLPPALLLDGLRKTKYAFFRLHPDKEDIINTTYTKLLAWIYLRIFRMKNTGKTISVTVESLPKDKTTLLDKKIFSEKNTLITRLYQISVQELIGKEKDFLPFWNEQCKEISRKSWLPTEIDSVDLHLNSSNLFSEKTTLNSSSLTIKKTHQNPNPIQENSSLLSTDYQMDTSVKEDIRTVKIRIYPNKKQSQIMKKWMGTRRYIYNKVLKSVLDGNEKSKSSQSLRNKYVTSNSKGKEEKNPNVSDFELETPQKIREGAIRDLTSNFSSAFSNIKNGNIHKFNLGFSNKKSFPSILVNKECCKFIRNKNNIITGITICPAMMSKYGQCKNIIKLSKKDNYNKFIDNNIEIKKLEPECDFRLKYNKYGEWYICLPYTKKFKETNNDDKDWIAIDPGVRKFHTCYNDKHVIQINPNKELLKRLRLKKDKYQSLRDKKIIKNKSYSRRERKINRRIENIVYDFHHKTANYLTDKYNYIILPYFESQEISKKSSNKYMNRELLCLSHYSFSERLYHKCKEKKCYLDRCTEQYTSKTCGNCGVLNNVGTSEVYICDTCGMIMDRDSNGARNIAIKRIMELKGGN